MIRLAVSISIVLCAQEMYSHFPKFPEQYKHQINLFKLFSYSVQVGLVSRDNGGRFFPIDLHGLVGLWCLTPLSTVFQLYRGGQFYW